ncbi:DUF3613 domain-containing protein [Pseudomonas sp. SDI]|uniref:DUF3613 domain-containing protein n=1 Tax=Pseudomonas sp. SDI TaxID=2170734 RepID=UPI0035327458
MAILVVLVGVPMLAQALEPGPSSTAQAATEAWLRLQVNGERASPQPQTQTPKERDLSQQRFLDSYKYPLPEAFKVESMGQSGE